MKNIIIAFFILLALPTFAQNDLEGTWYGIVIFNGIVNENMRQEWRFEGENIYMREFRIDVREYRDGETKDKGSFKYQILDNHLALKKNDFDYAFEIKENTTNRLIIEREETRIIFDKQTFLPIRSIKETKIPSFVHYRIETENNEFSDVQFYFFNFNGWLSLVYHNIDEHYDLTLIEDKLGNSSNRINLLYANLETAVFQSIIFNVIHEKNISGWINGNIPFKFVEIKKKPTFTKDNFINRSFQQIENQENSVKEENRFVFNLNKKVRTINVGKNHISFLNDTISVWKKYVVIDTGDIDGDNEDLVKTNLVTTQRRWYLDSLGENIYVYYHTQFRGFIPTSLSGGSFIIKKYKIKLENEQLILTSKGIFIDYKHR